MQEISHFGCGQQDEADERTQCRSQRQHGQQRHYWWLSPWKARAVVRSAAQYAQMRAGLVPAVNKRTHPETERGGVQETRKAHTLQAMWSG